MSHSLWSHGRQPARLLCPWASPGQNTAVGSHFFLQGLSWPRDRAHLSFSSRTGRRVLFHGAPREPWGDLSAVVRPLGHTQPLTAIPWTAVPQASSCFTISWSLLTLMRTESVVPASSLILCCPLRLLPSASRYFPMSQLAKVLELQLQHQSFQWIFSWFPLGLTGLILQSKGLSRVFSNTTVQKHQFFRVQSSLWSNSHIHTWPLEKPQRWLWGLLSAERCPCFLMHCLDWSGFFPRSRHLLSSRLLSHLYPYTFNSK